MIKLDSDGLNHVTLAKLWQQCNRVICFFLLFFQLAAIIDKARISSRSLHLLDNHHYNGRESFKGYGYYF